MRKSSLLLTYNGTDISEDIADDVRSFKFVGVAADEADTIDVTLDDRDKKWLTQWMPQAGDKLTASILLENWEEEGDTHTIRCGTYILDEPSYSAPPHTQKLSAIAVAVNTSFVSEERSRTWTDAAISEIAAQIASENGLDLLFSSTYNPRLTLEQSSAADLSFLAKLCADYTLRFKVADETICIYDPLPGETQPPYADINEAKGTMRYSFKHTYLNTGYTDVTVTAVDEETGEYVMMEDTAKYQGLTEEEAAEKYGKTLTDEATEEADDPQLASRKLAIERMKEYTAEITVPIIPQVVEGCPVHLDGFGSWSGQWIVDKLTIALPAATMAMTLHKAVIV